MNNDFDKQQKKAWAETTNLRSFNHPVVELFARQRVNYIQEMLGEWRPETALDVGCGDGFGMVSMKALASRVHGCDQSPAMLAANPAEPALLTECSAYHLPFADESFDLVYCWELLHHIAQPQQVVNEMARVSKKCVLLCEPNRNNPSMAAFGVLHPHEWGLLRFSPTYPKRLLERAGLEAVHGEVVGAFTPNRTPLFLARWLSFLPYRIPWIGLYTITIGFKK